MNTLKIFQIDAFAAEVFRGNPAAVVPLDGWLPDATMQSIAAENNLAETAFLVPLDDDYGLRWFTPVQEVPLCGHATLASAFVVFSEIAPERDAVVFHTQSGRLTVRRDGDLLAMDLPRREPTSCDPPALLLEGLVTPPREVLTTNPATNYYAVYDSEAQVRALVPDFPVLARLHPLGVAVTARGVETDFVLRFFAPSLGIPEDPVTGSTHCALIPYWARRLARSRLDARQVSARRGDLICEDRGESVVVSGRAKKYLAGTIYL